MNKKCLCTLRIEYHRPSDGRHKSQSSIIHLKVTHLKVNLSYYVIPKMEAVMPLSFGRSGLSLSVVGPREWVSTLLCLLSRDAGTSYRARIECGRVEDVRVGRGKSISYLSKHRKDLW